MTVATDDTEESCQFFYGFLLWSKSHERDDWIRCQGRERDQVCWYYWKEEIRLQKVRLKGLPYFSLFKILAAPPSCLLYTSRCV